MPQISPSRIRFMMFLREAGHFGSGAQISGCPLDILWKSTNPGVLKYIGLPARAGSLQKILYKQYVLYWKTLEYFLEYIPLYSPNLIRIEKIFLEKIFS